MGSIIFELDLDCSKVDREVDKTAELMKKLYDPMKKLSELSKTGFAEYCKNISECFSNLITFVRNISKEFSSMTNKDLKDLLEQVSLFEKYKKERMDLENKELKLCMNASDYKILMLKKEWATKMDYIEKTYGANETLMALLQAAWSDYYRELIRKEEETQGKSISGWMKFADSIFEILGGASGKFKNNFKDFFVGSLDKEGNKVDPGYKSVKGWTNMLGIVGKIPGAIKEIINNVKAFIELGKSIAKFFGWMTEEMKVQKDVLRDLGATISDDLAKKIADSSKEIGDRFTAVTLHLGDIMRETDITADNFDTFASRARDVFSLLETGMMNSAQATDTLNDVFPQLADEMDKLGITFNKNMIEMIQLSRQFGLEVESIKQYVEERLGIAVQGLTTATQNLGEIGQAEFDRLARAASATILIASMIYVVKKKFACRFHKGLLFNDRM